MVFTHIGLEVEPRADLTPVPFLVNKGFRLGDLKRSEKAIAVYDEVVKRFGEAKEPALQEVVGQALKALRDMKG